MKTEERIEAFQNLGAYLKTIDTNERQLLVSQARAQNSWFTEANILLALEGLTRCLNREDLTRWVAPYPTLAGSTKKVGIVMAGNIPFVGFHDLLCVLMAGHSALVKLSSKDAVLIRYLAGKLAAIEPRFESCIQFVEQLRDFDAVIATGSDNSARYFEYYFSKYPHVIRKNRTSCAILAGDETSDTLNLLGHDVFSHFGLGCRNVSKLYVPEGYDLIPLIESWNSFADIIHHHKYHNNYDYQKSIMLVNRVHFLDNGFVMFTASERLVSPIAVVYFEQYASRAALRERLATDQEKIQCVVGCAEGTTVPFGQAQYPALWDYADQIDTLKFLASLN